MRQVQATTTLTVDGTVFQVEKMSAEVKSMIALMDSWRQKELDASDHLTMVRGALRDLQNSIYVQVSKERQEALEKAKAMGLVKEEPANDGAAPEGVE